MVGGESLHLGDDLVDRLAMAHLRPDGLQATGQRVRMAIAEGRHQEAAVEVDLIGSVGLRPRGFAERLNSSVDD